MNLALSPTQSQYTTYAITLTEFIQPADERKIRTVFDNLKAAWAANDIKAFEACFTKDSDVVTANGIHHTTASIQKEKKQHLLKEMQQYRNLYFNIKTIRFINDTMAVVHAETTKTDEWQRDISGCQLSYNTTVLVKENKEWKITSIHNSRKEKQTWFAKLMRWFQ